MQKLITLWNAFKVLGASLIVALLLAGIVFFALYQGRPEVRRRVGEVRDAISGESIWKEQDVTAYYAAKTRVLGEDSKDFLEARRRLERETDERVLREEAWASQRLRVNEQLVEAREALEAEEAAHARRLQDHEARLASEKEERASNGFQKVLEFLSKNEPPVGADLMWYWEDERAAKYLQALPPRRASEIVGALVQRAQEVQSRAGRGAESPEAEAERARASRMLVVLEKNGFLPATVSQKTK